MPGSRRPLDISSGVQAKPEPTRVALVGCGAVSERSWIPALAQTEGARVVVCVDRDRERAETLAARIPGCTAEVDWRKVIPRVDLAILALPHHLHAAAGEAFLAGGRHVLMEKPLASSSEEVRRLLAAASGAGTRLFVAQVRRLLPGYRFAREILDSGALGAVRSVSVEEGGPFSWPLASDAQLRQESAGGGVLMDTGGHVVDALAWWLGNLEVRSCEDDAAGGIEAESEVAFAFAGGSGRILLSRLRALTNRVLFEGERASLEIDAFGRWGRILSDRGTVAMKGEFEVKGFEAGTVALFREQFEAVRRALSTGSDPAAVTGEEGGATIAFIEECYRVRTSRLEPWQIPVGIEAAV